MELEWFKVNNSLSAAIAVWKIYIERSSPGLDLMQFQIYFSVSCGIRMVQGEQLLVCSNCCLGNRECSSPGFDLMRFSYVSVSCRIGMVQGEQRLVCSNCHLENQERSSPGLDLVRFQLCQCQLWNWNGQRWTTPCLQQLTSGKSRTRFTWTWLRAISAMSVSAVELGWSKVNNALSAAIAIWKIENAVHLDLT